jgi:hypothetical protein
VRMTPALHLDDHLVKREVNHNVDRLGGRAVARIPVAPALEMRRGGEGREPVVQTAVELLVVDGLP